MMEESLAPEWLDHSFLNQVLQSVEDNKQEVELLKWTCQFVVPPGSNYLSQLYRVGVEYKLAQSDSSRLTSLIVKIPLESGIIKEFCDSIDAYGKELRMYKHVLPKMYELHSQRLTPRAFFCPLENSLVLEDLLTQNYKMADRLQQLDVPHCRQFLLSLSRLHALSVAVHHSHPDLVKDVGKQAFFIEDAEDRDRQEMFMKYSLNVLSAVVEHLPECERYAETIRAGINDFYDKMVKVFKRKDGFNVLTHGDTWTNNIMYKYESGEVVDAKLVDFQVSMYGSFAQDIVHFWWTSANEDVRENHREEMFEVYRLSLNRTLQELKCSERLSKEEFDRQLKDFAPYSVYIAATVLSVVMADPDNLVDFKDFSEDEMEKPIHEDSLQTQNYHSKYYKAILPNVLRQMEEFGAFL